MNGVLLDTNVISELARPQPSPQVVAYLARLPDAWLSIVTLHELEYGIRRHPSAKRRVELEGIVSGLLAAYADRLLPVGPEEARSAAALRVQAEQGGHALHLADALIAGTAQAHGLTIATRNVGDFAPLGVPVVNPWG